MRMLVQTGRQQRAEAGLCGTAGTGGTGLAAKNEGAVLRLCIDLSSKEPQRR